MLACPGVSAKGGGTTVETVLLCTCVVDTYHDLTVLSVPVVALVLDRDLTIFLIDRIDVSL